MKTIVRLVMVPFIMQASVSRQGVTKTRERQCVPTERMPIGGFHERPPERMPIIRVDSSLDRAIVITLMPCYLTSRSRSPSH